MRLRLRCVSCQVGPSDTSGFFLDIEVADRRQVLDQALSREQILNATEDQLRWFFGDDAFEEDARRGQRAIDAALIRCGLAPAPSSGAEEESEA